MEPITIEELYEMYNDTLDKCGTYLLNSDELIIGYNIFEEFATGSVSYLHKDSLMKLYNAGYISKNKMMKSLELREMAFHLHATGEWDIKYFKESVNWKKLLELSDSIRLMT